MARLEQVPKQTIFLQDKEGIGKEKMEELVLKVKEETNNQFYVVFIPYGVEYSVTENSDLESSALSSKDIADILTKTGRLGDVVFKDVPVEERAKTSGGA